MAIPFKKLVIGPLMLTVLAWASSSPAQLRKFIDPQKVVTIQGQIAKMETITRQGRQATHNRKTQIAHLQTDKGVMMVHLGPAEFLAQQNFLPKNGDILEVTGGRVNTRQGEVLLATTVKSGGKNYLLRDDTGIAVWSGQTPGCYGPDNRKAPIRS